MGLSQSRRLESTVQASVSDTEEDQEAEQEDTPNVTDQLAEDQEAEQEDTPIVADQLGEVRILVNHPGVSGVNVDHITGQEAEQDDALNVAVQLGEIRSFPSKLGIYCNDAFFRSGRTTLGMLYFVFVLCFGVAISLSVAIRQPTELNETYTHYFFVLCMAIGIVWMIGAPSLGCCLTSRERRSQIPCYMIFGVTVFCLGSCFISGVDFLLFVYSLSCDTSTTYIDQGAMTSDGIFDLVKLLFLISQLHFICRFSDVSFRKNFLTSFFILHIIAVNLTTWFYFVVNEAVVPPSQNYSSCPALEHIDSFVTSADRYLYPFNIEYTTMSSVLFFIMWYELWDKSRSTPSETAAEEARAPEQRGERCCSRLSVCCCRQEEEELGDTENAPKTMLFWKSSPCGYVTGILILTIQLVALVISGEEYEDSRPSAIAYYVIRIVMFALMTVLSFCGLCYLPRHEPSRESKIHTKVDSILIVMGVSGCYLMMFFNVISAVSDMTKCKAAHVQPPGPPVNSSSDNFFWHNDSSSEEGNRKKVCGSYILGLFIADNIVALVQFTLQAIFITQALRRSVQEISLEVPAISRKVVCNISAILSFANIGIWVLDTFELKDVQIASFIDEFAYGELAWRILAHIAFPLCIFFRLHSTFCFFELNINRFGIAAKKDTRSQGYVQLPQREESRDTVLMV